jgi:nicotinamide-nucleotide amidase
LRIFGLRESEIAQRLEDLEQEYPAVQFGYFPHFPENHLSLIVQASTETAAKTVLEQAGQAVRSRLGIHVYGKEDDTLESIVGRLLFEHSYSLALAESCTGGLIAHLITNVSGSSTYFDRSLVTYSNAAKIDHLFVSSDLLSHYGAVSKEVAEAMVRGLHKANEPDIALSVTGIAGPTGGTKELPVGTVFLALLSDKGLRTERFQFGGGRQQIKLAAAYTALDWLRKAVIDDSFFR